MICGEVSNLLEFFEAVRCVGACDKHGAVRSIARRDRCRLRLHLLTHQGVSTRQTVVVYFDFTVISIVIVVLVKD